jgi:SAM-dependent methyltransferase
MFLPPSASSSVEKAERTTSARGIQFKRFEQVLAKLLPHVQPHFCQIPPRPLPGDWPWTVLPEGAGPSKMRKKQQLQSLIQCIVAMLPNSEHIKIVDFGGGTGHLAIPLALLLPHCEVTVVDLKLGSLRLVHEKAECLGSSHDYGHTPNDDFVYPKGIEVTQHDHIKRPCAGIPNLFTYHGSMERYEEAFDIGVGLHACGEASDLVLRACGQAGAAILMAPCCIGKLNRKKLNPYIYHATGDNRPTITYPQSKAFATTLDWSDEADWNALAKAADYSDWEEMRLARNATRRTAKALLETDRLLYLKEEFGYETAMTRMDPWEASPKHDILLGWPSNSNQSPFQRAPQQPDDDANADCQLALEYLLQTEDLDTDCAAWTAEEAREIQDILHTFMDSPDEDEYIFPTRMGGRKRKLIYYVASKLGLHSWAQGRHNGKAVIVAKIPEVVAERVCLQKRFT